MSNVEYRIFVVNFCRQAQGKKSKQTFKIRHGQIDDVNANVVLIKNLIE